MSRFLDFLKLMCQPHLLLALLCVSIVVLRMFYPELRFDSLSRDLLLISLAALLLPEFVKILGRLRKFKWGENELELDEAIDELNRRTKEAEERADLESESFTVDEDFHPDVQRYLSDPKGGLIAVAADIEARVNELVRETRLNGLRRYISPMRGIELLAKRGAVVADLPALMRDFWALRNQAVHDNRLSFSKNEIYRLVELGVRILELLSLTKNRG